MPSFSKKIVTLVKEGFGPLEAGFENFKNPTQQVESLAKDRAKTCIGCPLFVDEPVDFLRVTDTRIPELSDKMCDGCGCTLSYKTRQSIKPCDKWQK